MFQAGTQFKASLSQLMEILMSKEPSYIRCIKPNDTKSPDLIEDQIVKHQVCFQMIYLLLTYINCLLHLSRRGIIFLIKIIFLY